MSICVLHSHLATPIKALMQNNSKILCSNANKQAASIFYGQLAGLPDVPRERLSYKRSFVPAARKLLNDICKLGIREAH